MTTPRFLYLGTKVDPSELRPADVELETIPVSGVSQIVFRSDELTCRCPVTGQVDFYTVMITLIGPTSTIESKSLKLFLQSWANDPGIFAEHLATAICGKIRQALSGGKAVVELTQKARGGIQITTTSEGEGGPD